MLHLYAIGGAARALPRAAGGGGDLAERRADRARGRRQRPDAACRRPRCSTATSGSSTATSGSPATASRAASRTVFAKTDPDAESKHAQFSAIIVPTDTPGYDIVRAGPDDGPRRRRPLRGPSTTTSACPRTTCSASGARASPSPSSRLGPGRIFHCMRWLGQAQRAFELMCRPGQHALRARLAADREGRDPALRRRVRRRDPGVPADDPRRRARHGPGRAGPGRDLA